MSTKMENKMLYKKARNAEVIWRWWKISLRSQFRNVRPGERMDSHNDFLEDENLQSIVGIIFGKGILKYICNLCRHEFDYLERLPDPLLLYTISYLELEDLCALSQTSKKMKKLCNSNDIWEDIVLQHCDTITPEMRALAIEIGWKEIFFTSKLQLQKQIQRKRQKFKAILNNMI
ncbi:F-box only protein 36 isoform X2 [Callorhinchus milii]|uniref:F-box protein 36a n=1 Tax=Callorhinchus milii TaxID=7868 RepID=A0A4W3HL54_CALMI|nr:F-box only protein 36 isoform X2 [Callorhinchus milii]|eukprot:gi/632933911/ref/XP_007892629.1/ PREDICTED: F-box only protein 36 isoform X2 [Callorhinchus milii]